MNNKPLSRPDRPEPHGELFQKNALEVLQELERHGYTRDSGPAPSQSGMLLRHRSAPDLLLREDGRIDLPFNQPTKNIIHPRVAKQGVFWRRSLSFLILLAILTFLGFALVLNLLLES